MFSALFSIQQTALGQRLQHFLPTMLDWGPLCVWAGVTAVCVFTLGDADDAKLTSLRATNSRTISLPNSTRPALILGQHVRFSSGPALEVGCPGKECRINNEQQQFKSA